MSGVSLHLTGESAKGRLTPEEEKDTAQGDRRAQGRDPHHEGEDKPTEKVKRDGCLRRRGGRRKRVSTQAALQQERAPTSNSAASV